MCSGWKVLNIIRHQMENSQVRGVWFAVSIPLVNCPRKGPNCPVKHQGGGELFLQTKATPPRSGIWLRHASSPRVCSTAKMTRCAGCGQSKGRLGLFPEFQLLGYFQLCSVSGERQHVCLQRLAAWEGRGWHAVQMSLEVPWGSVVRPGPAPRPPTPLLSL